MSTWKGTLGVLALGAVAAFMFTTVPHGEHGSLTVRIASWLWGFIFATVVYSLARRS